MEALAVVAVAALHGRWVLNTWSATADKHAPFSGLS
jgi:hypothetical protein